MNFKEIKFESRKLGEKRDCAVIAAAIVCGIPYKKAHAAFKRAGRRDKGRTKDTITFQAIRDLGFRARPITTFKGRTVRTIEKEIPVGGRYLIFVNGHVLAARHGEIQDWSRGRKFHVRRVYKVEKC